ncbi:MAG: hypothetical protein AB8B95_12540 [Pseudohongiellaceae bacterium]
MKSLIPYIQFAGSALSAVAGLATLTNLVFISQRPETISVVNTIIGQGVLIIALFAISRILFKKAVLRIKTTAAAQQD